MISPPASPGPTPVVRREVLAFLACLVAAVGLFALLGLGYLVARDHVINEEIAPARISAQIERLAAVLPTLQRLEVTYYERDQSCRAFSYRRGGFIDAQNDDCDEMSADMPFDAASNQDVRQLEAALADAGIDAYEVVGSLSKNEFEFATHAPGWCLFCPNVAYYHAHRTGLPADDLLNHYLAIDADWYVDIYDEGIPLGP